MTTTVSPSTPPTIPTSSSLPSPLTTIRITKPRSHGRQSTLSLSHRLLSISHDSTYITRIHTHLHPLPLLANLRCGLWYIPPRLLSGCAYFKSTDGHFGEWAFSSRRLNLNVVELAGRSGGCVVVDSARRGKEWPDSLSKTVPVWCAVLNALLFPERQGWGGALRTPGGGVVSGEERKLMEGRMAGFLRKVEELDLDVRRLRDVLKKPLYPIWLPRDCTDFSAINAATPPTDVTPIYLCTASTTLDPSIEYIQGAGDDAESWAYGLTPAIFWAHRELLLRTSDAELPGLIASLVAEEEAGASRGVGTGAGAGMTPVSRNGKIFVGALRDALFADKEVQNTLAMVCASEVGEDIHARFGARLLHLKCGPNKLGSRDLRRELGKLPIFIDGWRRRAGIGKLCICCADGTDLAVGVALVVLCLYGDELEFLSNPPAQALHFDKVLIRRKLNAIISALPTANPSRTTLNTVNGFLMKRPS